MTNSLISGVAKRMAFLATYLAMAATITATFSAGQAEAQSIGHRRCCNRPEVFLIRGGAGYWPNVATFAEMLQGRGFATKTVHDYEYLFLANQIAAAYHAGEMAGPVTIVGYSSGADAACLLCGRLNDKGVPVTNLVLVESTLGTPVPSNVSYCFNVYESRGWTDRIPAFRGIEVRAKNPATQIINANVKYQAELAPLLGYNHFTIPGCPEMHNMLSDILVQRYGGVAPSSPQEAIVQQKPSPVAVPDETQVQQATLPDDNEINVE